MKCKICDSTDLKVIGKPRINDRFPKVYLKDYRIIQCENCSFYFINPDIDLNQKEWSELYKDDYFVNKNITAWQRSLHQKERVDRINLILRYLDYEPNTFLDIGCGEGFVLNEALINGFIPYGLDIAKNMHSFIDLTKVHFFEGNIFEANYQDNFFSAIYMDSVLEHVDDPKSILKEMHRILKPKGVGLLIVPNENSLTNDTIKLLYMLMLKPSKWSRIKPFDPPYHINGFNNKSLRYAIENAGFKIIDISQFSGNYQFWRAHKPFSLAYFREFVLYPSSLLSVLLRKQGQLQVVFTKV